MRRNVLCFRLLILISLVGSPAEREGRRQAAFFVRHGLNFGEEARVGLGRLGLVAREARPPV